ncbi:Aquaporin [Nannochloropsis gaditana]|uniref:Aquaporin n=1 Tax=Nannochloropsis gaditana TaxID=72520 RepID=W7TH11_9STRA|nr:Aquaporin [Nannochloropsis gaditana]
MRPGDEEEAPLVLSPRRGGPSPLAGGRAAWFGTSHNGATQEAQSYGAFVKSTDHSSMDTISHQVDDDTSLPSTRLPRLFENWPLLVEMLASYTLGLAAFSSNSSPWTVGLIFAGLAHAASTSAVSGGAGSYYLQANPVLTLGQLVRGHLSLPRAVLYCGAQFLGITLACLTFATSTGGGAMHAVGSLTSCDALPWGHGLFLTTIFASAFAYVALAAWDSMSLALEACCSFYGLATGAAYAAAMASVQSRSISSGLLNPWVGLVGVISSALAPSAGSDHAGFGHNGPSSMACDTVFILGPLLGALLGCFLSWLTSLHGSEKEAMLRALSPIAPLLVETVGVMFLVLSLGAAQQGWIPGAFALALTLCAWRRSGAQFNPSVTLAIFLLKRRMFRWTSLLFYILAHVAGALLGTCLLLLLPPSREMAAPSLLDTPVVLGLDEALLLLVFTTAYLAVFVANTDAEYDEGFLHPALMVGLTLTGLLGALAGRDGDVLLTGLYNPAVTLVVWAVARASVGTVLLGASLQLLASGLVFALFWGKAQVSL